MDQQVEHIHVIHKGEKLSPEDCRHPADKLYSWFAEGPAGKILCSVCLQCNSVIAGGVDDENDQEPIDNRRWQCPACKKRTMRETKAPSGPQRANGQYNCTYCDYTCDGNKLLLAGMGGFRMIEGD